MTELIERREYKYLTDDITAAAIREAVRPFCALDRYGADQPNGCYTINSLYFDTPTFDLYAANRKKLVDRFKLRIRSYPPNWDGPVFFEVKRRINDAIKKTRAAIDRVEWANLVRDPGIFETSLHGSAIERFLALVHTYHAQPACLVRYEREAWVSEIDSYARVTFDRNIRCQVQEQLELDANPSGWRNVDHEVFQKKFGSMTIVELKFTTDVPRWMMNIVRSLDLFRNSFSKYGTAIQTWLATPFFFTPKMRRV